MLGTTPTISAYAYAYGAFTQSTKSIVPLTQSLTGYGSMGSGSEEIA